MVDRGYDRMVVGFTSAIRGISPLTGCEFESRSWRDGLDTT